MSDQYLTIEHVPTHRLIRFFSKLKIDRAISYQGEPCWLYPTSAKSGYAMIRWGDDFVMVHRFIYAWLVSPILRGKHKEVIDHLCRRRNCCNPAHLELVTPYINNMRGYSVAAINRRKTHCPQGHPYDETNTLVDTVWKQRLCRTCQRLRTAATYHDPLSGRRQYQKAWQEANRDRLNAAKRERRKMRNLKSI